MRWLIAAALLALGGCSSSEPTKVDGPKAENMAKKGDKAKAGKAGARKKAGPAAKRPGAKKPGAKPAAGKGAASKGKVTSKGKGRKGAGKTYGTKGEVLGKLELAAKQLEQGTKTKAQLELAAGDKTQNVPLGIVNGTCSEIDPKQISEEKQALWSMACQNEEGKKSELSIVQSGQSLVVARAMIDETGATGKYKQVRRVKLVPGTKLARQ